MKPAKDTWLDEKRNEYARAAKKGRCTKCGEPVITGLDEDIAALRVEIDPGPIDELGEFLALAAGRPTFEVLKVSGAERIYRRSADDIGQPRKSPVHAAHHCGRALAPPPAAPPPDPFNEGLFAAPDGFPF